MTNHDKIHTSTQLLSIFFLKIILKKVWNRRILTTI